MLQVTGHSSKQLVPFQMYSSRPDVPFWGSTIISTPTRVPGGAVPHTLLPFQLTHVQRPLSSFPTHNNVQPTIHHNPAQRQRPSRSPSSGDSAMLPEGAPVTSREVFLWGRGFDLSSLITLAECTRPVSRALLPNRPSPHSQRDTRQPGFLFFPFQLPLLPPLQVSGAEITAH